MKAPSVQKMHTQKKSFSPRLTHTDVDHDDDDDDEAEEEEEQQQQPQPQQQQQHTKLERKKERFYVQANYIPFRSQTSHFHRH